jgi:protein-disulfide isomerase
MQPKHNTILSALVVIAVIGLLIFGINLIKGTTGSGNNYNFEGITRPIVYPETPILSQSNSELVFFEFGDFSCPSCKAMQPVVSQIKAKYSKDISFAWKNFAFLGDMSRSAAIAAQCANEQEKFWTYKSWLFSNQDKFSQESFIAAAVALGLERDKFVGCLSNTKIGDIIDRDFAETTALGIDSTPTIVIGDIALIGVMPFEEVERVILQELVKVESQR